MPARGRLRALLACLGVGFAQAGCVGMGIRHEIQGDNYAQVLKSDESQVRVRVAQSRYYDTRDKRAMIEAVVATMQDLGFQIAVLDERLGIVTGKKYLSAERPIDSFLPTYLLYDEESLVVLNRVYRTWGPFQARADLVRLTVTIRDREDAQLIVRASAQYYLRPVETEGAYQAFFATLEKALFAARAAEEPGAAAPRASPSLAAVPAAD